MYPDVAVIRVLRAVLVPVALMSGVFLVGADSRSGEEPGRIRGDVRVGGIPLQGQTLSQAERTLKEAAPLEGVRLVSEASREELDAREAGLNFDAAATARKAYAVGREGNVFERVRELFSATTGTVRVEPVVGYEREAVERAVSRLDREPRNATVEMEGRRVRVVAARPGYEVDAAATARNLEDAVGGFQKEARMEGREVEPQVTTGEAEAVAGELREAVSEPLTLAALGEEWTLNPSQVAGAVEVRSAGGEPEAALEKGGLGTYLGDMYESVHREPESAGYEISAGDIRTTPSSAGRRIEDAKLFEDLRSGLFEGKHHYKVPVAEVEPGITTGEAERLKPTSLIGEYRTPYTGTGDASGARVRNLEKSSRAVDGAVIAPGEVFSFNELAAGRGYEAAKVIVDGQIATEAGGGLCQVSSTLYNAANDAGLEIVERAPHSAELPYIRPGLDATVWFGAGGTQELDMKFKNTTDSNILVRETVRDDGYVYAEIWGRPTGEEVDLDSERVSAGDGSTHWITYKTVERNGESVSRQRLHTDTYEPLKDEDGNPVPSSEVAPADW